MTECSICKFRNNDSAVYCADCGQRLQPAINSSSSSKLHSPLLDAHSKGIGPDDDSIPNLPNSRPSSQPLRPSPGPQNGLHSPLLDVHNAKSEDFNSAKPKTSTSMFAELSGTHGIISNHQQTIASNNIKGSKLHSPVLDGPEGGFEPENIDSPVEEYNSLRSPLLAAKVPLPEAPTLQSPPANMSNKAAPSPPTTTPSLFGPVSEQTSTEESYKQFATSLFESAPTKESPVLSPRQTGRFTKVASLKKEDKSDNLNTSSQATPFSKNIKSSGGQSVLLSEPKDLERYPAAESASSAVLKFLAILLLLASLVFKFCYWWKGLGPAFVASQTFLLDQIGQVIVILLVIMLVWKAKF